MPCSLAIRRGLRRAELPADARERGGRSSKKGEGEDGEEGRPVHPGERVKGVEEGGREREGGDLCVSYEGCGMGRHVYRGHGRKRKWKEGGGRGEAMGRGEEEEME